MHFPNTYKIFCTCKEYYLYILSQKLSFSISTVLLLPSTKVLSFITLCREQIQPGKKNVTLNSKWIFALDVLDSTVIQIYVHVYMYTYTLTYICVCVCVCVCVSLCVGAVVVIVQLLSHIWCCDSLNWSMLGFPILQYFPEFVQTHIHWTISSNHVILCHPLLLLPSIFPSITVSFNESALCIRWPKYWNFNFSISPSNEYSDLISFRIDWFDLLAVQGTLKSLLQQHNSKASIYVLL